MNATTNVTTQNRSGGDAPAGPPPGRRKALLAAAFALLAGLLLSLPVGVSGARLDTAASGDPQLADRLRAAAGSGRGFQSLSAAEVSDGQVRFAGVGAVEPGGSAPTPDTRYELGSITKTFTAALLADAVERGEVGLDDRLDTQLPGLAGTEVGSVTLRELATHRSGLATFVPSEVWSGLVAQLTNRPPYADSTMESVIAGLAEVKLTDRGSERYSNLGVSLLGHALARAAGAPDWQSLVRERILTPLKMTDTVFTGSADSIPPMAPGFHPNGTSASYWYSAFYAPAGSSTVTTARDLATYLQALLAQKVPGMAALDPILDEGPGRQSGLIWVVQQINGRQLTWHNGGTGGFRTWLSLDRQAGRGVLVLGNTGQETDRVGINLASDPGQAKAPQVQVGVFAVGLLVLAAGYSLWWLFRFLTVATRPALVSPVLQLVAGLILTRLWGPWAVVPGLVWCLLLGLALAVVTVWLVRCRTLPSAPASTGRTVARGLDLAGAALFLAFALFVGWPR